MPPTRQPNQPNTLASVKENTACLEEEIKTLRTIIKRVAAKAHKEKDPYKLSGFLDVLARSTVRLSQCLAAQARLSGTGSGSEFQELIKRVIQDVNNDWTEESKLPPVPNLSGWKPPTNQE